MTHRYDKIFTGVRDIDRETLMKLDEKTLDGVCTVNKYAQSLCDQSFWLRKLLELLGAEDETIRYDGKYRDLYKRYLRAASYQWIDIAAREGDYDIVRILLDTADDSDEEYAFALETAAYNGHLDIVKLMVDRGIDPRFGEDRPLSAAIEGGRYDVVRYLLDPPIGADPNASYYSDFDGRDYSLTTATKNGDGRIVKLLLEYGADPTINNNAAFIAAAEINRLNLIRLLLDYAERYED